MKEKGKTMGSRKGRNRKKEAREELGGRIGEGERKNGTEFLSCDQNRHDLAWVTL